MYLSHAPTLCRTHKAPHLDAQRSRWWRTSRGMLPLFHRRLVAVDRHDVLASEEEAIVGGIGTHIPTEQGLLTRIVQILCRRSHRQAPHRAERPLRRASSCRSDPRDIVRPRLRFGRRPRNATPALASPPLGLGRLRPRGPGRFSTSIAVMCHRSGCLRREVGKIRVPPCTAAAYTKTRTNDDQKSSRARVRASASVRSRPRLHRRSIWPAACTSTFVLGQNVAIGLIALPDAAWNRIGAAESKKSHCCNRSAVCARA